MITPKCVIHCRVSTGRQAYEGESLESQAAICRAIAERHGWSLATEPWLEAYSGRKAARPAFGEILAFLDEHPGEVGFYVFRAIDRFTRSGIVEYERMKQQLKARGVELVDSMGVIQPTRNTLEHTGFEYEWSRFSPSEIAEAVLATTAKAEATTILTRLIGQEISLTRQGYRIRSATDGYINQRVYVGGKRRVIQEAHPDRAHFYVTMFELRAAGMMTDPQIVDRLNAMGFRSRVRNHWNDDHSTIIGQRGGSPLTVKHLQASIARPIYCGVVWEKWTNWRPVRAAYPGLVSIDVYNAANRGLRRIEENPDGTLTLTEGAPGRPHRAQRDLNNPVFPFRRVVLCPQCRKPFMGSSSRSRSGRYIPAYHCARSHPRIARNKKDFEAAIEWLVAELRFRHASIELIGAALRSKFHARKRQLASDASGVHTARRRLEGERDEAVRAFKAATTDAMRSAIEADLARIERELSLASVQQQRMELSERELATYISEMTEIMEHPSILYDHQANTRVLRRRFSMTFGELPTLVEIENGTPKLSLIFKICLDASASKSALVSLRRLKWNQIVSEIERIRQLE